MRTTLEARIKALEGATTPSGSRFPVVMLTLQGADPAELYAIDCDGQTWEQRPGETLDQLKARAMAGADLQPARDRSPFPVRMLCARPLSTGLELEHSAATH